MKQRSQAERDAITVEICYALFSAVFAAAVVFAALVGPTLAFAVPYVVERGLLVVGAAASALVFAWRVTTVLWRFSRRTDQSSRPDQPSQPGRTNPDS
ncbi:DUF6332 family protein [Streptomyces sp. NPDC059175]|uniref:DUF6332 family protein n=1 Tax=Streptomyces sp. NPDC059175 TaxID=3346757 RepID=UPI0036A4E526